MACESTLNSDRPDRGSRRLRAAYQANVVFAPLTLGLFVIALVWPPQDCLQQRMSAILRLRCLNIIQFVIGSYVEPRVSGNVLSIYPMVVLFAVFSGPSSGACTGPSSACQSPSPR